MALASQSVRSQNRPSRMMSSRRLLPPRRLIGFAGAALVVALGTWWLLTDREPDGGTREPPTTKPSAVAPPVASSNPGVPASVPKISHAPLVNSLPQQAESNKPTTTPVKGDRANTPVGDAGKVAGAIAVPQTPPESPSKTPISPTKSGPTGPSREPAMLPPSTLPVVPTAVPGESTPTSRESPVDARPPAVGVTSNADLARAMQVQANDPVQARLLATRALDAGTLSRAERDRAYQLINGLTTVLFLNPNVNPGDPVMTVYTVDAGDTLQKIPRTQKIDCDYRLLKRLNAMPDEHKLRIGQRLRVPKSTFHAEVIKSEFRLNLYVGEGSDRVMLSSFRVGLGESNGTPTGLFKVRPSSKLTDPQWTHPRTGQHFASKDPLNPIGAHWIGLIGVEDKNKEFLGYGIHGTIEPDSIGEQRSLGCVRMVAGDVELVFECLTEPNSTILIK